MYLPPQLFEDLHFERTAPPSALLAQTARHLVGVRQTIATHLPPRLIESVRAHQVPGCTPGQFVEGTLLFADISGFTALSERLSRVGREGAEKVTAIVNRYFRTMLAVLHAQGGQLIKFGGDALLGAFEEPNSAVSAVQAALRMQAAMADFAETHTSQGVFPLRMKIGIHRGRFFAAQLGTVSGMEYTFLGAAVNATAATEAAAETGQVVVDQRTLEAVEVPCAALPLGHHPQYFAMQQLQLAGEPWRQPRRPRSNQSAPRLMDCGRL